MLLLVDAVLLSVVMEPPGLPTDELLGDVDALADADGIEELIDDGLLLLLLVVVVVVDVLLYALPTALVMAVTDAHSLSVPAADVSVFTLAVAVVPDAVALTSAFLLESALHVRSTKSPALMSLRVETALPCTDNVMVPGTAADALAAPASFTVIVLELASTEMTSAPWTDASFFLSDLSSVLARTFSSLLIRPGSVVVLPESCWAAAVPATRTRPSNRVSFFMFPPVGYCKSGRCDPAVDDDLEEPKNRLE
jgi:hypothetical protein